MNRGVKADLDAVVTVPATVQELADRSQDVPQGITSRVTMQSPQNTKVTKQRVCHDHYWNLRPAPYLSRCE
jgi:hypothetical protein